ncbi:hypothetical protein GWK36_02080 [Caldichromatium japonicum]|uniref:Uncharacterized protein n=1 Tax=Caldichromatium japonicum TaxID=2699430 RepID=A0A6G7VAT2_9GAMM|nr:hypothetical protein [Caldichromatium japonicum]QIK36985.1 hypothetical protein GWK36_02080 [Caldichromatium japonicum]
MILTSVNAAMRPIPSMMRATAPQGGNTTQGAVPPSPGTAPEDLNAEIQARIEQDPDYQILRRTLDLSSEAQVQDDELASPPPAEPVVSDPPDMPALPAGVQILGVRVEASRQQLALSIRADDSAVFQQLALEITGGGVVQQGDPLVLDLGGQGITTTGIAGGIDFDLNGDGRLERMSTVYGQSWFLALDRNGNGYIDDGRELFGDQNGAVHGFAELGRYDDNTDGRIDQQDAVFARLRLVQLGARGAQTLQTLGQAQVAAIELNYQHRRVALAAYDQIAQTGRFIRSDGTAGQAADLLLGYHQLA